MGRIATFVVSAALLVGLVANLHSVRMTPYRSLTADAPLSDIAIVGDSYTNGTDIGGKGPNAWTARAFRTLARDGAPVAADVAAEGRAGYGVRGDHGSLFVDLTARAVKPNDDLVVFYGSRNDQGVDLTVLGAGASAAFATARGIAPTARLLVIGTPWPTANAPLGVLQIRDTLAFQAHLVGATFVDPIALRWFVDRPDLIGRDGVHPTDAGHAYMAEKIAPLILAQLPRPR